VHYTALCIVPDLNSVVFPWLKCDSWLISQVDYQIFSIQSEANKGSVYPCQALKDVLMCDVSACKWYKKRYNSQILAVLSKRRKGSASFV